MDEKQTRSLSSALAITPDVTSFIEGNQRSMLGRAKEIEEESDSDTKAAVKNWGKTTTSRRESKKKAELATKENDSFLEARVPFTTRFRLHIAEALRRASLQRKLNGVRPWSQQEIVESAVERWLKSESSI